MSLSPLRKLLSVCKARFLTPGYSCPVCDYQGVFEDLNPGKPKRRRYAQCPSCGSLERHRLQWLIVEELARSYDFSKMRMLHFAPEAVFGKLFSKRFWEYTTTDLNMETVDVRADVCKLPFADESFDAVYLSHVFEHVKDDKKAFLEVRRILTPGGFALIHVPILSDKTIEYPEANPNEHYHVRACGIEFYERGVEFFSKIKLYRSGDFSEKYQLYAIVDWTGFPTSKSPYRKSIAGKRHPATVAVYSV